MVSFKIFDLGAKISHSVYFRLWMGGLSGLMLLKKDLGVTHTEFDHIFICSIDIAVMPAMSS